MMRARRREREREKKRGFTFSWQHRKCVFIERSCSRVASNTAASNTAAADRGEWLEGTKVASDIDFRPAEPTTDRVRFSS